jgi:hypothetical protein
MRGKLLLVVGMGIGYVLGARAGRERYEDIKRAASKLWNDPKVQRQVRQAGDFAKDKAPDVVEFLSDGAKKVATQVGGSSHKTTAKSAAKAPARKTTTSAAKSASSE